MNIKETKNETSADQIDFKENSDFEMIINPRFNGDKSYDNLSSLKQSIHFLLNVNFFYSNFLRQVKLIKI